MFGRKRVDVPESLARGRERFEAWRRSRKVGSRIPDSLWSLAVCRSINQMKGGTTQDQLLDLCDRLEAAERCGDGMLDTL